MAVPNPAPAVSLALGRKRNHSAGAKSQDTKILHCLAIHPSYREHFSHWWDAPRGGGIDIPADIMSSYFDFSPKNNAPATDIGSIAKEQNTQVGNLSLLSPAVSQLLDELGQEQSDSDSDEAKLPEEYDSRSQQDPDKPGEPSKFVQGGDLVPEKQNTSSLSHREIDRFSDRESAGGTSSSARASGSGPSRPKQPHMARFHSLRSMLFSSTIEEKIKKATKEDCAQEEETVAKWKNQHDQRQMHNKQRTSENAEKDALNKDGKGTRIKTRIRRMTSKEVPTMTTLKEHGASHDFSDHGSTASSNTTNGEHRWRAREVDEESINDSDVEELVRWVNRRDPPSDGEARASNKVPLITEVNQHSDHDSVGDSDIDDLVRHAHRRSPGCATKQKRDTGYSDASTESDSEMQDDRDSSDDEDAEELVRWISHREGSKAGPVQNKQQDGANSPRAESQLNYDSDVPELGRWIQRYDGTSGESGVTTPIHDLQEEEERGRLRSRDSPAQQMQKGHLTQNDVDELVRWVSAKKSNQSSPSERNHDTGELLRQEDEKKQQLGMTVDEGSLSHSDAKEILEHVKNQDISAQEDPATTADIQQNQDAKKQQLGMTVDEGSLSHSDVKDLIEHIRTSELADHSPEPAAVPVKRPGEAESGDLKQLKSGGPETTELTAQQHLEG